ncbi:MAG: hypothetical protein ACE5FI_08705, partial [Anaerolineales bacterium]
DITHFVKQGDHLKAAQELQATLSRLLKPDDVRTYVEVTLGAAQHLISFGLDRRFSEHPDHHAGMARTVRQRGHPSIADALVELEHLRLGRWYGHRGNGQTIERCDELLDLIETWAVA